MYKLKDLVVGFLLADGFYLKENSDHYMVAEKEYREGLTGTVLIWVIEKIEDESSLLLQFSNGKQKFPEAMSYLIVDSLKGLSSEFRSAAKQTYNIQIRTVAQFFDTPYKQETKYEDPFGGAQSSKKSATIIFQNFKKMDLLTHRVSQPFYHRSHLDDIDRSSLKDDLFVELFEDMRIFPEKPKLRIIVGSAGAGKSVLFQALFTALYDHFIKAKQSHLMASRPVLFLPEHLQDKEDRINTMDELVDAVIEADVASAAGPGLFEWLHENGYSSWLFDGLDEFYAESEDFFDWLEDCLAHGRSQVLICVRDSLLTSSGKFRDFLKTYMEGDCSADVEIYELAPWDFNSKRALAWLKLDGNLPTEQSQDSRIITAFLERVENSNIKELSSLPYYCDLLLDQFVKGNHKLPENEFDLLEIAFNSLISREEGKLVFDWDVFMGEETYLKALSLVDEHGQSYFEDAHNRQMLEETLINIGREKLVEFLGYLAHRLRCSVKYPSESGLSVDDIKTLGSFYTDLGLSKNVEPRVIASLVHFAFFGSGAQKGTVKFTHELLADYIAGKYAAEILLAHSDNADLIGQMVGIREDFDNSLFARYLRYRICEVPECINLIRQHVANGIVREKYKKNIDLLLADQ